MRHLNILITAFLAVAAATVWFFTAVVPGKFAPFYSELQGPLAVTLSAAACLGWLMIWLSDRRRDNETRCRKCGYILRGISEPRCPECGERI